MGHEAVWQSACDVSSILPLLHMLRAPDDAAKLLMQLAGGEGERGGVAGG